MTEYLELDDLLVAARAAVGDHVVVRDVGLFEAALARPRASAFGEDAYPDLHTKAAALLASLVRDRALADGNKRLGWVAGRLFYVLNDHDVRAPEDDAYELVMRLAEGTTVDVVDVAAVLSAWIVEL